MSGDYSPYSLEEIAMMDKRDIEELLIMAAVTDPLKVIREAGFIPHEIIGNIPAKNTWEALKARIAPDMNDKDAKAIALTVGMENRFNVFRSVDYDLASLSDHIRVISSELMKRHQNSRISAALPSLFKALADNNHDEVRNIVTTLANIPTPMGYSTYTALDAHEELIAGLDRVDAVRTYIEPIDEALGGVEKSALTVIAARPSVGKTAIAWQIARNMAAAGQTVLFVSLEMSRRQLWKRAACPLADVDYRSLMRGDLSPSSRSALTYHSEQLAIKYADKLVIDDRRQTTDGLWNIVGDMRPDCVIIDHMRLLKDRMTGEKEHKRLGRICENLKDMAKGYDIPVIALAQLNRSSEEGQDKRPTLVNLRDSGEIEEDADVVLMLHRPDYYVKDGNPPIKSQTEIWVEKSRNGSRNNVIKLIYDLKNQWFERMPR